MLIVRRAKLYYTVSAIITPIRGCTVHRLREFISCFYMFRAHVLIIRRSKLYYTVSGIITLIGGRPVYQMATYRCDDTRDCVIQFCPPDDEHMCLKQVEAWNKLIKKFSASSWLILMNKYIVVHGQQNIKKTIWVFFENLSWTFTFH